MLNHGLLLLSFGPAVRQEEQDWSQAPKEPCSWGAGRWFRQLGELLLDFPGYDLLDLEQNIGHLRCLCRFITRSYCVLVRTAPKGDSITLTLEANGSATAMALSQGEESHSPQFIHEVCHLILWYSAPLVQGGPTAELTNHAIGVYEPVCQATCQAALDLVVDGRSLAPLFRLAHVRLSRRGNSRCDGEQR